jgi:hypothetical protein
MKGTKVKIGAFCFLENRLISLDLFAGRFSDARSCFGVLRIENVGGMTSSFIFSWIYTRIKSKSVVNEIIVVFLCRLTLQKVNIAD